jgi:uncharacterized protein YcfL
MKNIFLSVALVTLVGCNSSPSPTADAAATAKGMETISARQKKLADSDKELAKIMARDGSSAPKEERK